MGFRGWFIGSPNTPPRRRHDSQPMADKENTEVPPASQSPAPVTTAAPVTVVRERGSWVTPLIAALVVVVALVVGGVSGFALAAATHAGARPAMQQSQQGPQQQ